MKRLCMKIMEILKMLFGGEPYSELLDDMDFDDCGSVMGYIKICHSTDKEYYTNNNPACRKSKIR